MVKVIINRNKNTLTLEGPINSSIYIFRSFSKNNNGIVPTYVFHVNDENQLNIKITLPQCNTIIIDIPNK